MKRTFMAVMTIAAAVTVLLLAAGCNKKDGGTASVKDEDEAEQVYAVSTLKTTAGNLDDYLEFGGDIASVNSVAVMPDQAGKITNILVSVGDLVKK